VNKTAITVVTAGERAAPVSRKTPSAPDWEARRRPTVEKKAPPKAAAPVVEKPKAAKLSYKDQRDYDLLPERIDELEGEIARDEDILADPDLYARDPERFAQLTAAIDRGRAERDAAEERWLELAEQVEALTG